MAPKVVVPADFGRHHIGSPSHGNLIFNLGKGVEVKANSIILSLNSPVIDELTSKLHLLSLEADDFSREAVDCFVEATYTGEIEAVNLDNFRDVNKMSRVFQVSWLVAKFKEYFVLYLNELSGRSDFSQFLFVIEESLYLLSALKDQEFYNLVVNKMSCISAWKRSYFIRQYLVNLSSRNQQQIDICLKIVSPELRYVIVELLLSHLAKGGNKFLDQNSRYIINHMYLGNYFLDRPDLGKQLFSVLEDFENYSKEDSKLFLRLLQQKCSSTVKICESINIMPQSFPLLHKISKTDDIDNVLEYLIDNRTIDNMYSLLDLVWSYLFEWKNADIDIKLILNKMIAIKEAHSWNDLDYNYIGQIRTPSDKISDFMKILMDCERIVSASNSPKIISSRVVCEYPWSEFVDKIVSTECSEFKFPLSEESSSDNECILTIGCVQETKPETCSMRLTLSDPNCTAHLVLEWFSSKRNKWIILPMSWCGRPKWDTSFIPNLWRWGYLVFSKSSYTPNHMSPWVRYLKVRDDDKCRLKIMTFHSRQGEQC